MKEKVNWPQLGDVSTDPVVVGLGRLLVVAGLLVLATVGTIAWLVLRCVAAS